MVQDLTELRGEGWKRLLAAARRSLERTGGAPDRSIGLSSPTDAERRVEDGCPVGVLSIGDMALERDERSALADISAQPPNR